MYLLCVSQAESLDAMWGGSPADPDLLIPVCGEHKLVIRTHSLYITRGDRKTATHWASTNWSSGLTAYITRDDSQPAAHWAALQIPSGCLDLLQAILKAFQGAEVQLGRAQGTGRHRRSLPCCGSVLRSAQFPFLSLNKDQSHICHPPIPAAHTPHTHTVR